MADLPPPRTVVDYLGLAAAFLAARGLPSSRLEAELLLGHALSMRRLDLYLHHDRPLDAAEVDAFRDLLRRRGRGEPVAYLTGTWGFRKLTLATDARALVPRPETEVLVELALGRLPSGGSLLDVGTGTGAIALAVATERPDARVVAIDVEVDALALAAENAALHAVSLVLLRSDLYEGLADGDRFDVIVANLPYIAVDDPRVEPGVRDFEPHVALFAGSDGLDLVRRAVMDAPRRLAPGGVIALELGEGQAETVVALACAAGLVDVRVERDLAGIARFVLATLPAAG